MLDLKFDYKSCISNSEKVAWHLDELFPVNTRLSFDKPHMPDVLAGTANIAFLKPEERLRLNQIRGNSYMNLFGFVEEYIIAQTVQHAEAEMFGDHDAIRALLRFGEEEVKHQQLFKRYTAAFERDFGTPSGVLQSAAEVAHVILSKSPIAVMLTTLHLELMTQYHYTGSVKDNGKLDALFSAILKAHWLEESQHAKIDTLELDKMMGGATQAVRDAAYAEYFGICTAFDGLLAQQTEMDVVGLEKAVGRKLSPSETHELVAQQLKSYRSTIIGLGMTHPTFVEIAAVASPTGAQQLKTESAKYA